MSRIVFLGAAGCFFILGAIGVVVPGLPTTPFLLLTSYCLMRSSPKLNDRLLRSRFFGPLILDWRTHGGIRRRVKVTSILLVTVAVGCSVIFVIDSRALDAIVLLGGTVGILVIVSLPVIPNDATR